LLPLRSKHPREMVIPPKASTSTSMLTRYSMFPNRREHYQNSLSDIRFMRFELQEDEAYLRVNIRDRFVGLTRAPLKTGARDRVHG